MSSSEIHQRAIALLNQLPPDRLAAVVQLLEFLAQPAWEVSNPQETALLELIQWQLPENEQRRLQKLRDRCEWEQLTKAEYDELIRYEDLLEQKRAERLKALIAQAKLRNIDLIALNRQLKWGPEPFNAA